MSFINKVTLLWTWKWTCWLHKRKIISWMLISLSRICSMEEVQIIHSESCLQRNYKRSNFFHCRQILFKAGTCRLKGQQTVQTFAEDRIPLYAGSAENSCHCSMSVPGFLLQRVRFNSRVVHVGFVVNKMTLEKGFLWAFQFSGQLSSHCCSIGPPDMTVATYCLHLSAIRNIHMYSRIPLTQHPQELTDDGLSNYSRLSDGAL
jgi:hypothetical protein